MSATCMTLLVNVLWLYDSYTTYLKSNIVFTMQ
ncbi:hypothetical protein WD_0840 [Wolbachia endosymbiont of Drosophila melanogaster]|nr:hypothetical protein WD_0840 [Wolbachia endosymbiont of Drosophila melanogaster]